ncbi:MAG: MFS transporter, partial [Nitrososphaerota archaeon]|nr:MFS transporter [Nitrososphaerota archaeon]
WKQIVMLGIMDSIFITLATGLQAPFSIGYLAVLGVSPTFTSLSILIGNSVGMVTWMIGPFAAEKFGRKRAMMITMVWFLIGSVLFFPLLNTKNLALIVLAQTLISACIGFGNAPIQTLMGESFPTKFRYSGAGVTYQMAALIAGVVTTAVASTATYAYGVMGAAPYLGGTAIALTLIALVCNVLVRDTRNVDLRQVDNA